MKAASFTEKNIVIEANSGEAKNLYLTIEAAKDCDAAIRNTTNEETRALAEKIKALATDGQKSVFISLTKKEFRDLVNIALAMATLDVEDYFPQLLEKNVTEEVLDQLYEAIDSIQKEYIAKPEMI